ncbi:hypothetical protein [Oryzibacter oryziterrae]|uniref:hypothetical protein n=1 Tax=Oryzibacter oryziterrae TaxID=2766474 RepID=UPI001F21F013|nr:hypothetical protein [Oryzibacter oryziterrae]
MLIAKTPDLLGRVEHRLAERYAAAKAILEVRREVIHALAEELEREASVTGERIAEVMADAVVGEKSSTEPIATLLLT